MSPVARPSGTVWSTAGTSGSQNTTISLEKDVARFSGTTDIDTVNVTSVTAGLKVLSHRCVPLRAVAPQYNAYGKFSCESGDGGAVRCRAATARNGSAGSGVKEP